MPRRHWTEEGKLRAFSRVRNKATKQEGTVVDVATDSSKRVTSARVQWDQTSETTWEPRRRLKLLRGEAVENPPPAFLSK